MAASRSATDGRTGVSEPAPGDGPRVEVGADAAALGRAVRDAIERGERRAAFVGDPDADPVDAEALTAFVTELLRSGARPA